MEHRRAQCSWQSYVRSDNESIVLIAADSYNAPAHTS
jgi:hypothetical protein